MLSQVGNLLFIIKLCKSNGEIQDPIFGVDKITGGLYAREANSMTLILERATIMPQVSTLAGLSSPYPSQVFSPPLMADNS